MFSAVTSNSFTASHSLIAIVQYMYYQHRNHASDKTLFACYVNAAMLEDNNKISFITFNLIVPPTWPPDVFVIESLGIDYKPSIGLT